MCFVIGASGHPYPRPDRAGRSGRACRDDLAENARDASSWPVEWCDRRGPAALGAARGAIGSARAANRIAARPANRIRRSAFWGDGGSPRDAEAEPNAGMAASKDRRPQDRHAVFRISSALHRLGSTPLSASPTGVPAGVPFSDTKRLRTRQHATFEPNNVGYLPVSLSPRLTFPRLKSRVRVPFPALRTASHRNNLRIQQTLLHPRRRFIPRSAPPFF